MYVRFNMLQQMMSQVQKPRYLTESQFVERLNGIIQEIEDNQWAYQMTLERVLHELFKDVEQIQQQSTGLNRYITMLKIQQNFLFNYNYIPALDAINFDNQIDKSINPQFDRNTQDSFRSRKLIEDLQNLKKHEKKRLQDVEKLSKQNSDDQDLFQIINSELDPRKTQKALDDFEFIQKIYPYFLKEMIPYDEQQERSQILKRQKEGQMQHRRSRKNFILSYLILILNSTNDIYEYESSSKKQLSFKKESYMTQKIRYIFNFLTTNQEYKKEFVSNEEIFLFELISLGNTSTKFLDSLWFLFKIHYTWFNWAIQGAESEEIITHKRKDCLKELQMNNITFLKIFQGTLFDHIEMFQLKQKSLEIIMRKSSYNQLSIKDDSKMKRCHYIELKVSKADERLDMLEKQAKEIIRNSFQGMKLIEEEGVQEHFCIYLNPYLFKDQYLEKKASHPPSFIDSRQKALHKCFQRLIAQNKSQFNKLTEAYTFLQCEDLHIFCFVFKKPQSQKTIQQFFMQFQSKQIKRISGQKKTLDFKSEFGAFEIIKAIIVYIDDDSIQWGAQRKYSVEQGFQKNLFQHLLHEIREEKHKIYLTSGLPTQEIIEGTKKHIDFCQTDTQDNKICTVKLSQKYFNIFLDMLERYRIKTFNPVLQATTLFIVLHSHQFLELFQKTQLKQMKPTWFANYMDRLFEHIKTMRGHGITSLRLHKYQKLLDSTLDPKLQNCQQIFEFIDESFKEFEMEPLFSIYNSFWKYLKISIKIITKAQENIEVISNILKRQETMCILYNYLGKDSFPVKNEIIWLEVYFLALTYGRSLIGKQLKEDKVHIEQTLKFICQLARKSIQTIQDETKIKSYRETNPLIEFLFQQMKRLNINIYQDSDFKMEIFCNQLIREIQRDCENCYCCRVLKPFHSRKENCYQRFALLARMIQEKCIHEYEQTQKKLSDKLLMQKYKAIMTKAYSLNSELLQ